MRKMKYTLLKNKVTGVRSVRINKTGEVVVENENPIKYVELRKKALASANRRSRDSLMEDMGLTKVRGAVSGKVYWE